MLDRFLPAKTRPVPSSFFLEEAADKLTTTEPPDQHPRAQGQQETSHCGVGCSQALVLEQITATKNRTHT